MDITKIGMTAALKMQFMSNTNKTLFDYEGGDNVIYVGMAEPGTKRREAKWQLKKITYNGDDNITAMEFAEGSLGFEFIWNNRASYTYS